MTERLQSAPEDLPENLETPDVLAPVDISEANVSESGNWAPLKQEAEKGREEESHRIAFRAFRMREERERFPNTSDNRFS